MSVALYFESTDEEEEDNVGEDMKLQVSVSDALDNDEEDVLAKELTHIGLLERNDSVEVEYKITEMESDSNPFWKIVRHVCSQNPKLNEIVALLPTLEKEMTNLEKRGKWIKCKEVNDDQLLYYNNQSYRVIFGNGRRQKVPRHKLDGGSHFSSTIRYSTVKMYNRSPTMDSMKTFKSFDTTNSLDLPPRRDWEPAEDAITPGGRTVSEWKENILGFETNEWDFQNEAVDVYRSRAARRDHKSIVPDIMETIYPEYFSSNPVPPSLNPKIYVKITLQFQDEDHKQTKKIAVNPAEATPPSVIIKLLKKPGFRPLLEEFCTSLSIDYTDHTQYVLKVRGREEYFRNDEPFIKYSYTRECLTNECDAELILYHRKMLTEKEELAKQGRVDRIKSFDTAYHGLAVVDSFLSRWETQEPPRKGTANETKYKARSYVDHDSHLMMKFLKVENFLDLPHAYEASKLIFIAEVWMGSQFVCQMTSEEFDAKDQAPSEEWSYGAAWNSIPPESTICIMLMNAEKRQVLGWTRFPVMDSQRKIPTGERKFLLWKAPNFKPNKKEKAALDSGDKEPIDLCDFRFRGIPRPMQLKEEGDKCTITVEFEIPPNGLSIIVPRDPYVHLGKNERHPSIAEDIDHLAFNSLRLKIHFQSDVAQTGLSFSKIQASEHCTPIQIANQLKKNKKLNATCVAKDAREFVFKIPNTRYYFSGAIRLMDYKAIEDQFTDEIQLDMYLMDDLRKNLELGAMFQELMMRSPIELLTVEDKRFIFEFRHRLFKYPSALPIFISSVDWKDSVQILEARRVLNEWDKEERRTNLIELLDYRCMHTYVREFVVKELDENFDDATLSQYLLELVQCLKFELHHDSALSRFLLRRSIRNPYQVGNIFFWHLKAEYHNPQYCERFGLIMEEYLLHTGIVCWELNLQQNLIDKLKDISAATCYDFHKKGLKDKAIPIMRRKLEELNGNFPEIRLPLMPTILVNEFLIDKCKCMSSKKVPLWLEMRNADPFSEGTPVKVIFKNGDDLRQDMLTLQIFQEMELNWLSLGLHLPLKPYRCISTGDMIGFLEVVDDSRTMNWVFEKYGGQTGAWREDTIINFLKDENINPGKVSKSHVETRVQMFTRSCAGYMIATYVLGVGDRHPDNFMITKEGRFLHIDFGHFLGNFKKKFNWKRERTPMVFTKNMRRVIEESIDRNNFQRFKENCEKAYKCLRDRHRFYINLFRLMLPAEMPELLWESDINYLAETLHLEISDSEIANHLEMEITNAMNDWYRAWDAYFHGLKHN